MEKATAVKDWPMPMVGRARSYGVTYMTAFLLSVVSFFIGHIATQKCPVFKPAIVQPAGKCSCGETCSCCGHCRK